MTESADWTKPTAVSLSSLLCVLSYPTSCTCRPDWAGIRLRVRSDDKRVDHYVEGRPGEERDAHQHVAGDSFLPHPLGVWHTSAPVQQSP